MSEQTCENSSTTPSGEKILAILINLLAEQESVEITYEPKKQKPEL